MRSVYDDQVAVLQSTNSCPYSLQSVTKLQLTGLLCDPSIKTTPEMVRRISRSLFLDWTPILISWALGRRCELVDAHCSEPRWQYYPFTLCLGENDFDEWCPHCANRILTYERLCCGGLNMNTVVILTYLGRFAPDILPEWAVALIPRLPVGLLMNKLSQRHAVIYLGPLLDTGQKGLRTMLCDRPVSLLVSMLRHVGLRASFGDIIQVVGTPKKAALVLLDPGWHAHIDVDHAVARKYCRKIPGLACRMHPADICALDTPNWPVVGIENATALNLAPLDFFLYNHSAWGYVTCGRAGLFDKRRLLLKKLAETLMLCSLRPGPWSSLDPWLIKHIVSFLGLLVS